MISQRERLCHAPSLTETWEIEVNLGAATSVAPKSFAHHLELSSVPTTLKLTTATDKEVKIFGLRHVHLQCQDLSLRVSFVIADVVTPLLGMDMVFQHNLSLIFERGQSFLVNKAGKRTQLQQKGEQLYIVACPCQHGLSTSFCGSLSDVVGFLPEDKELHEQKVALQSSSSTDLVEDRGFPEPLHVHDKSKFFCVLCKEKAVVSGGELSHNSLHPLHRQQPKQLSNKEQQLHKHPRSSLHRSVELQEAKAQEITHALSTACVYDLPDLAWKDPVCVFRGHPSQSQLSSKNSGSKMTNKLSARHRTRSSKSQVETGTESSTALHTVVSVGSPAFFGEASLVALMVQLSVLSPLAKSELAYEESLKETEEALADTSLLQLSPAPSLNLTSLQLQSVFESLSSNLCFLISMLVASIVKRDRFQLWSFQLTRAQLCSLQQRELVAAYATDESFQLQSLQQKELVAAYAFKAQLQDRPTRASQLQLSIAQLCSSAAKSFQLAEESLQKELVAAYAFLAQECSTRASPDQLDAFQVFRSALRTAVSVRTAFQTGALQETGFAATAFQDPGAAAFCNLAAATAIASSTECSTSRLSSRTRASTALSFTQIRRRA